MTSPSENLADDLRFRGLIYQTSSDELLSLLDRQRFVLYGGFDPSQPTLQLGNLMLICTLCRFQDAGHSPIALAGGGTGLIGDPGGRDEERPLLSTEQHRENMAGIRSQLERYLDFRQEAGDARAILVDNADWLCKIGFVEFLRDVGKHFTVNQMVARESVKSRLERPGHGISFTEFSYMLLQAYDFLHLYDTYGCRLQVGGSDQWGNIVSGVDLVRRVRAAEVFAATTPLVLKADGSKMGKSAGGETLWLDPARTSPYELYQSLVRTEDHLVPSYLRYLTFLGHDEIRHLDTATAEHPERREGQRALAISVVSFLHGTDAADGARRASEALFGGDVTSLDLPLLLQVLADAPSSSLPRGDLDGEGLDLVEAVVRAGLWPSKSAARTAIAQGAVYVNDKRREGGSLSRGDLVHDRYVVLRKGRKDYHLLCLD